MFHTFVNFEKVTGVIKPLHAVNNGPTNLENSSSLSFDRISRGNAADFRKAGIPYARTHDASFYPKYGLEHTVDVVAIFPDFDADPYDPASYDFTCTDHYLDMIAGADCKVFYRLGHRIEHEIKKYGTLPPKDFHKWAVICEHIIRHVNEGWADGAHRNIEYWEIWNEPDLDPDDAENKRTWGGTKAQFFEFYHIAATHLKACFPHLKIGGPALAGKLDWAEDFLAQLKAPLDFFSWHVYAHTMQKIADKAASVRTLLDKYGFTDIESILNEWNYVLGWNGDDIVYSYINNKRIKGASFNLAAMSVGQAGSIDMMMYYDARPTAWNGLFDFQQIGKFTTTAYHSFPMFNTLYRLGTAVETAFEGELYAIGAKNDEGTEAAVVLTRFVDDDTAEAVSASLDLTGFGSENGTEVEVYLLDETHELTLTEKFVFFGDRFRWKPEMPNYTCYLLKLKKQ